MGLILTALSAAGSVLGDQWKEYFYCESIPANILVTKGHKRTQGLSSNHGSDNIISNGSVIAVADGQCMIIVEQGKVVDLCAEPGEYVYDTSTEPSIFAGGDLADNIKEVFANIGKRFTFGGEAANDQRVYYFNTKELVGNKFGTPSPVPFRVVDANAGIDIDVSVRCFGEYSFRIVNPILFYTNVCGNVSEDYDKAKLEGQMKAELLSALQPAFARISDMGIRYSAVPGHTLELSAALNDVLSSKWRDLRGIEIVSFGVASIKASEEDERMIKDMQKNAAYKDPGLAAATLVGAQADAMKAAASNSNGAMNGFIGMNMAMNAGGANAESLYANSATQPAVTPVTEQSNVQTEESWTCDCGSVNSGNFCVNCGKPKPVSIAVKCENCGWEPADPSQIVKFCPNCGKPFRQ